jgi:MFS transporter, DHA2 family, multidrug resistance protein
MAQAIDKDSRAPASASTTAPPPTRADRPRRTNPYVGILGVFLGAGIATLNSRLISVGLPDLRGALSLGFDEASWIPTALNMAMMFSGVFVVFFNVPYGPRRILLPAAAIFTIASALLPFTTKSWAMLALLVIAGIASGTFYSLTLTFVLTALPKRLIIFGIAAYAADIVFVSNFASAIEGWYVDHLSWRWIFWNAVLFTPLIMVCVYCGIPRQRLTAGLRPNWRGFAYFSVGLSLLYAALDQGERLDWLNSGVIVALVAAGLFLASAAQRLRSCRRC